jgi:hypothetical protein
MWILQNDMLMEIPSDVPMPPNSTKIEVPDEFLTSPRDFRIEKGLLIKDPRPVPPPALRFTLDEIAQLKQLVASTAVNTTQAASAPQSAPRKPSRRKEDK